MFLSFEASNIIDIVGSLAVVSQKTNSVRSSINKTPTVPVLLRFLMVIF